MRFRVVSFLLPDNSGLSRGGMPSIGASGGDGESSQLYRALAGTAMGLIVIVSFLGNLLVCLAVCIDVRLRTRPHCFNVSLAAADMLVAAMVMCFDIFQNLNHYWPYGQVFCKIWMCSDIMYCTASILNLCAISLDRYLQLQDPIRYDQRMTPARVAAIIGAVWIVSALISFLPLHLGWHEPDLYEPVVVDPSQCIFVISPLFALLSSSVSFYVPCLVMTFTYYKILGFARLQVKNIRRATVEGGGLAEREGERERVSPSRSRLAIEHKATVTLGTILGAFMLCWLPFFIANPIAAFCQTCVSPSAFHMLLWLGYFNSCVNPFIYSFFNRDFRSAFCRLLCPFPSRPTSSGSSTLPGSSKLQTIGSTIFSSRLSLLSLRGNSITPKVDAAKPAAKKP